MTTALDNWRPLPSNGAALPPGYDWQKQQEEEARKIRTRAATWLRNHLAVQNDNPPDEEEREEIQALSVAAHLQADRIPEAIYTHRVLLGVAVRSLHLHGSPMNTEYSDILGELTEYLTCGGYVYEDGEYRPLPRLA